MTLTDYQIVGGILVAWMAGGIAGLAVGFYSASKDARDERVRARRELRKAWRSGLADGLSINEYSRRTIDELEADYSPYYRPTDTEEN